MPGKNNNTVVHSLLIVGDILIHFYFFLLQLVIHLFWYNNFFLADNEQELSHLNWQVTLLFVGCGLLVALSLKYFKASGIYQKIKVVTLMLALGFSLLFHVLWTFLNLTGEFLPKNQIGLQLVLFFLTVLLFTYANKKRARLFLKKHT
ncbi:hypothetical protein ACQCT5_16345 [Sutcliffiella halmapala]